MGVIEDFVGVLFGVLVLPACVFALLAWCVACAVSERAYA